LLWLSAASLVTGKSPEDVKTDHHDRPIGRQAPKRSRYRAGCPRAPSSTAPYCHRSTIWRTKRVSVTFPSPMRGEDAPCYIEIAGGIRAPLRPPAVDAVGETTFSTRPGQMRPALRRNTSYKNCGATHKLLHGKAEEGRGEFGGALTISEHQYFGRSQPLLLSRALQGL